MKPGLYWYRMQTPGGEAQGYARLRVKKSGQGTLSVTWELRIVHQGQSYEEERSMALDSVGRMVAADYATSGMHLSAKREGTRLKGAKVVEDGKPEAIDVEAPEDAIAGMGFVLAASMEFTEGATISRSDFNEAAGFKPEGTVVFTVAGREPAAGVECWKVLMRRQDGRDMPLWVNEERELVQVDWGGGNLMVLSPESTRHLFKPPPPAVEQIEPKDRSKLVVAGEFPGFTPQKMFEHWTNAELIAKWWPQKAVIDAEAGGRFHMIWDQPPWYMRGEIKAFEPAKRLTFSWTWDHAKEAPSLEVTVDLEAIEGGTRLRIAQGPYSAGAADQEERAGHLRGWQFFCSKLRRLGG
jgi:uncharacterized protein YndB with AHSA1/START domain